MAKPQDETILASEVPRKFGQMLNDVLRGKSFTVTRNGQPIGRFVPIETPTPAKKTS